MSNYSHPNKFHGNISEDMPLANVFEQIAANQKHGWVFLKYPQQEVCLYFQGDLVGLVSPPEKKIEYIPEKLYYSGSLLEDQYQAVISSEDPLKSLEEQVPEEEITHILNTICYDEVCNLLNRHEGYFEFVDQNHPQANQELVPIGRLFAAEGLLMEAANRQQEWKELQASLPDWDELLTVNSGDDEIYGADDPMGNILTLGNQRTLHEIVLFSYFGEFDTLRMVSGLMLDGQLRVISNPELKSLAVECETKEEWDRAIYYYQFLYKRNTQDTNICESLVNCYEKSERSKDLADFCRTVAYNLLALPTKKERTQGGLYLKKYANLVQDTPEEMEVRLYLFDMVNKEMLDGKAIEYNNIIEGKNLFKALRFRKEDLKARQIIEVLLNISPHDKDLQRELINVCLDLKDIPSAVTQYENIAKINERDRDWKELEATYQKIVKLMPSRKDIAKKLDDLQNKKMSSGSRWLKRLVYLVILAGLGTGGWFGYQKYLEKKGPTNGPDTPTEPVPPKGPDIAKKVSEFLAKADKHLQAGDIENARAEIRNARELKPLTEDLRTKIGSKVKEIDDFLAKFDREIANMEAQSKISWNVAMSLYRNISDNAQYKKLMSGKQFKFAVKTHILPESATVTVDGSVEQVEDKRLVLSPDFKNIKITLGGYKTVELYNRHNPNAAQKGIAISTRIDVRLEKQHLWAQDISTLRGKGNDSIVATPIIEDNVMYIASSTGRIYALSNLSSAEPKVLWKQKVGERFSSFSASPCFYRDNLYLLTNGNKLYQAKADTGSVNNKYVSMPRGSISSIDTTPTFYQKGRYSWVILTAKDGKVYATSIKKKRRWSIINNIRTRPLIVGDRLFCGAVNGYVYAYNLESQGYVLRYRLAWRKKLNAAVSANLTAGADGNLYAKAGRSVYQLGMETGEAKLLYTSKATINDNIFYKDHIVYFSTQKSILAISTKTGKPIWKHDSRNIPGPFFCSPLVSTRNVLYIGNGKGIFYAIQVDNGKLLWKYQVGGKMTFAPISNGNLIIQISDKIYAFIDG